MANYIKTLEQKVVELERLLEIERERNTHPGASWTEYSNAYNTYIEERLIQYGYHKNDSKRKFANQSLRYLIRVRKFDNVPPERDQMLPRNLTDYEQTVKLVDQILPPRE